MGLERARLLGDNTLRGLAWCRAYSDVVDAWLVEVLERATEGDDQGVALVAVGGYGRAELCPQSDIDLMLLHARRRDVGTVAERIWYPIWDERLKLGHSVCTLREAFDLADDDLDTATALLSARHVAGDANLSAELADGGLRRWRRRSRHWLEALADRVEQRHRTAGEVAFQVEPDLKDGRGGLRDVHSLDWAHAAETILLDHDEKPLRSAYTVLLDARVELQRETGRPSNLLTFQDQDAVAPRLGFADADQLMASVAQSARAIAWTSDETWRRVRSSLRGPRGRVARRPKDIAPGVVLYEGEVRLADAGSPDVTLALRVAAAAAQHSEAIERGSLERLAAEMTPVPDVWPPEARQAFTDLLLAGAPAIPIIEAYDQRGIWTRILPEWEPVRARPQRNPYHRFTVDRHLLETVANAAQLAGTVDRPDLLVLAALLHDLGKGYPGDHSVAGSGLARAIVPRMGYPEADVDTVAVLVEQHLLLADVATRRDLDQPSTVARVASLVGSSMRLKLLAALTEADSLATGPTAWGSWKAQLIGQLVDRASHVLEGGDPTALQVPAFPSPEQLAALRAGGQQVRAERDSLTVITDDRPGVFSRISGVLALHGLDVLAANAYSSEDGRALAEFRVADPFRPETPWPKIVADLERALDGRLALAARVEERARAYGRSRRSAPSGPVTVTFDVEASPSETVIDIHTTNRVGVLYRITRALSEMDLDIRSAKVQTLGDAVVDAFYVRDRGGARITDAGTLAEIERAIIHSLAA